MKVNPDLHPILAGPAYGLVQVCLCTLHIRGTISKVPKSPISDWDSKPIESLVRMLSGAV